MATLDVPSFRRASNDAAHPDYRADIDGLRGIAVLAVVAFHAAPSVVRGGFVGVDVFFVISGFLITTILLKSRAEPKAHLAHFYARRIRRIFPALIVVLLATATLAWFILLADEYALLGKHVIAGATFSSNFVLAREAGYFDLSAERKPLLHLWSLAIEEQFYVFFPLALLLARWRKIRPIALVATLLAISFGFGVRGLGAATFYSPLARFWEILLGGLLADRALERRAPFGDVTSAPRARTLLAFFGVAAIAASIIVLSEKDPFPSGWALGPTLGTAALIVAGSDAWPNRVLFSTPILTWCGRISFPLYLWHWPLLSLLRIAASGTPSLTARLVVVAIAFVLAWITHVAIEGPLRRSRSVRVQVAVLAGALAAIGLFGAFAYLRGGIPTREVVAMNRFAAKPLPLLPAETVPDTIAGCGVPHAYEPAFPYCRTDAREPPSIALLGDSKSLALFRTFVRDSDPSTRFRILGGGGTSGMVPVLSDAPAYARYDALTTIATDAVVSDPRIKIVVLAASMRLLMGIDRDDSLEAATSIDPRVAFEGLDRTITKLEHARETVVFVIDNPTLPNPADCVARAMSWNFLNDAIGVKWRRDCSIPYPRQLALSKPYRDIVAALAAKHPALIVFDTLDVLCEDKRVCAATDDQGRLLYGFSDHVSLLGSTRVTDALFPLLRDALKHPR